MNYLIFSSVGIGEFEFNFGVYKSDSTPVTGIVSIGEMLTFKLDLLTSADNVLLSPQDCFATRGDGTGKVEMISDRWVVIFFFFQKKKKKIY